MNLKKKKGREEGKKGPRKMEKLHKKLVFNAFYILIVAMIAPISKALLGEVPEEGQGVLLQELPSTVTGTVIQLESGVLCAGIYVITMAVTESGNEFYADDRS